VEAGRVSAARRRYHRGGRAGRPAIGKLLAELEAWWEAGDFKATRKQCLSEMQRRLDATAAPA